MSSGIKAVPKHVCKFHKTVSISEDSLCAPGSPLLRFSARRMAHETFGCRRAAHRRRRCGFCPTCRRIRGGEAALKLPDLSQVSFFNGAIDGHKLLLIGILFCLFGLGFGMAIFMRLKNLPVHRSMREISELIYETCKTYLVTQGKFILLLWAFIAVIIAAYFGWLSPVPGKSVGSDAADYSGIQPGRHRGQLWSGVVRDSRQHVRQLADGVRFPAAASRIRFTRFRLRLA